MALDKESVKKHNVLVTAITDRASELSNPDDVNQWMGKIYKVDDEQLYDMVENYVALVENAKYKSTINCRVCKDAILSTGGLLLEDQPGKYRWVMWPEPDKLPEDHPHQPFLKYMKSLVDDGRLMIRKSWSKPRRKSEYLDGVPYYTKPTSTIDGHLYRHLAIPKRNKYMSSNVEINTQGEVSADEKKSKSIFKDIKMFLRMLFRPYKKEDETSTESDDDAVVIPDEISLRDWFIGAMASKSYKRKHWILRCFSISDNRKARQQEILPWDIIYKFNEDSYVPNDVVFYGPDAKPIGITDWKLDPKKPLPPFHVKRRIDLKAWEVPNLRKDVTTTYGNVLANYLLLVHPFGDILEFIVGRFSLSDVEAMIAPGLTSNPEEGEERKPGVIYVSDYITFTKSAGMISGLSHLCTVSATEKSMTSHPDMAKRKKELLEKHKDELDDPVVVSNIEKELIALDIEHTKGDPSENFILGGKSRNVIRKKSFAMMGMNTAFSEDSSSKLISTSLEEGIDIQDLPEIASEIREGSYDRGAETALGGDEVKKMMGVTQNTVIVDEDCGTTLTFKIDALDKDMAEIIEGMYHVVNKKTEILTKATIKGLIGKTVHLRTPYYCRQSKSNVCKRCIGTRYSDRPTSLPSALSAVGSKFMYIFMASMHAKEIRTSKYDHMKHII